MKLHATIAGAEKDVELRDEGTRVLAEIDGRSYEFDVHQTGIDSYLLVSNGQVFDCRVAEMPESGKTINVIVGAAHYDVALTDPKRLRGASSASGHTGKAAYITAPMPGKVVRLLVDVGDQIEAGTGIAVIEAMKMQNELKSPKAGTVVAINAQVGATVNGGNVLAVVE
jgi:biotin carboxyl carrier protein